MKQDFSDRASFLKATAQLRDATFLGNDLSYDEAARTMTLTVTRDASQGGAGGFLGTRKRSWLRTVITIRRIEAYKQYLAGEPDDVYVLDRTEVGRDGREVAFYFRPGDRAVMDVGAIEGSVEDSGRATSAPRKPVILNPLVKEERRGKAGRGGLVERVVGSIGGKPGSRGGGGSGSSKKKR
ncbi:MAG TPA: hypothetical protein VFP98_10175 [Candidatus Polarisedimenticolia bacterium]|nr:hypothetical protein [Candidatus Polarisedimenticolia bacterium]